METIFKDQLINIQNTRKLPCTIFGKFVIKIIPLNKYKNFRLK